MKSTIKPFSVEITKKDGFKYINDAVGYFPKTIIKTPLKDRAWLFVVEKVNGDRYMCPGKDIVDINTYGEEDE